MIDPALLSELDRAVVVLREAKRHQEAATLATTVRMVRAQNARRPVCRECARSLRMPPPLHEAKS